MANMLDFLRVINSYCDKMKNKGGLWLLLPEDAIQLTHDLEAIGVVFMGVEIWYPVEEGLAENYWDSLSVDDAIHKLPNASQISAELCRNYIKNDLPENITHVSFNFDIPLEWESDICK